MSEPPGTDTPGNQAARPGITPGLSFATVVQNGQVQAGGGGQGAGAATRPGDAPPMIKFSTFNTLSGGKLNINERPIQVVNETPDDNYLAYDIPADTSLPDWMQACSKIEIEDYSFVSVNPRAKVGIIMTDNVKDRATLEAASIFVRGKLAPRKRIIAHKDTLVYVNVSGFECCSLVALTQDIHDALSVYGKPLDIEFAATGYYVERRARALIDVSVTSIPGYVEIRGTKLNLAGNKVEETCSYCRDVGHHKHNCPKKRMPAIPSFPESAHATVNSAANRSVQGGRSNAGNRTSAGNRNNAGNRNSADGRSNVIVSSSDSSPLAKKHKRPRSQVDSATATQVVLPVATKITRKKSAAAPVGQKAAKSKPSKAPLAPIALAPGFITSFKSNASESAIPSNMSIVLSPTKSPSQPAASGGAQLGASLFGERVRPFTFPILTGDTADQSSAAQAAPAFNGSAGRLGTAAIQVSGQLSLGIAQTPPGNDGEEASGPFDDTMTTAAEHGDDSVMADEPTPVAADSTNQSTQPTSSDNVRASVQTIQGANGHERLLVGEVSSGGRGPSSN
ncbi:hypothetical protein LPJ60_002945 [Coemansia sp. RSA 2675]|nr:hypothetical protein LPJ60_002945 [Coemansia sp. RSA 2675]